MSSSTFTAPPRAVPTSAVVESAERAVTVRPRSRRFRATVPLTAWWLACLLCGGLVGLAFAVAGTVRGRTPSRRRRLFVTAGAAAQILTAGFFAVVAVLPAVATCPGAPPSDGPVGAWAQVRAVVNAPVSGGAMVYATARGADVCRCSTNNLTAALVPDGFQRGGTLYGTVYVTDPKTEAGADRLRQLSDHEARHADQWMVATTVAGPLAFPTLYGADESFFPGAHNHFERAAGLADGGYDAPPDSPPALSRLLFLVMGLLAGYLIARRRRPPAAAAPRPVRPARSHQPALDGVPA